VMRKTNIFFHVEGMPASHICIQSNSAAKILKNDKLLQNKLLKYRNKTVTAFGRLTQLS